MGTRLLRCRGREKPHDCVVNRGGDQEMQQLDGVLAGSFQRLRHDGRCCVISFKRKEQNAITKFMREHQAPDKYLQSKLGESRLRELFPLLTKNVDFQVKQLYELIRPSPL